MNYESKKIIYHHGIKGQRLGVRRYQNPDGSLTPAGERRYGSGFTMKENYRFTRYTPDSSGTLNNTQYMSLTDSDRDNYKTDALNGNLGFSKDVENVYQQTITNIEPIKIKYGEDILHDIVKKSGDKSMNEAYQYLKDRDYFLQGIDNVYKRQQDNTIRYTEDDKAVLYRKQLAKQVHEAIYKNRDKFISDYKKQGFDAIIDPEDLIYNYQMPMIITNKKKFKVLSSDPLYNITYVNNEVNNAK